MNELSTIVRVQLSRDAKKIVLSINEGTCCKVKDDRWKKEDGRTKMEEVRLEDKDGRWMMRKGRYV